VSTIRDARSRFSKDCADPLEFLAYTGLHTGEAKWLRLDLRDFDRGEILVAGCPRPPNDSATGTSAPWP
jgi:hypothetical protein